MVRAAVAKGEAAVPPQTPIEVLTKLIAGYFDTTVTNGVTVVSVSEAGGTTSFQIPEALDAAGVMGLAEQAIEWLEQQPDPANPDLSAFKRTTRLRPVYFRLPPL